MAGLRGTGLLTDVTLGEGGKDLEISILRSISFNLRFESWETSRIFYSVWNFFPDQGGNLMKAFIVCVFNLIIHRIIMNSIIIISRLTMFMVNHFL